MTQMTWFEEFVYYHSIFGGMFALLGTILENPIIILCGVISLFICVAQMCYYRKEKKEIPLPFNPSRRLKCD